MSVEAVRSPEFGGDAVGHLPARCTPRELFRSLLNPEENIHYLEPAYNFIIAALDHAELPQIQADASLDFIAALIAWAKGEISVNSVTKTSSSSWPPRIAREYAPVGLTDGAWLQGLVRANIVENEVGMLAVKQLMTRFGDPGSRESYVQRYSSLLRSIGVPPASISRWEKDDTSPCAELSYEHALLGLVLGQFPSALRNETIGFNLWMTAIGPCPLLDRLAEELRAQNANLQYLEMYERESLQDLAIRMAVQCLQEADDDLARTRIARGFAVAHHSYQRWESAMCGRNVPMTPRHFVLEMIRRKAHFALGHHTRVAFEGAKVEDLFRGGESGHEALLDHLVTSGLIHPGAPDKSDFISHSISFDGPMFDVFTASEQRDLREWIISLATRGETSEKKAPVALQGEYGYPQDPESLHSYAMARFGSLPLKEQVYWGSNSDLCPAFRLFARSALDVFLSRLNAAFTSNPQLGIPPAWSEQCITEIVIERHEKNIQSRPKETPYSLPASPPGRERPSISMAFDGVWLQGFADVHRSDREEYGWLFRIYASEQGDGVLDWNHNLIMRKARQDAGEETMLPATDPRLYDFCAVNPANLMVLAGSLNTRRFMPELLGCNLGIEATGVGGNYLDNWRWLTSQTDNQWAALSYRLHNSIDNYVTGHTKWSLAAIQSFMARVEESAPNAVNSQWQRIWRMWRLAEILEHGTQAERKALSEAFGFNITSFAPTSAALPSLEAHDQSN